MSNYNTLKTTINANIKQNGNQEITGQILNSVLNQMVTTLGAGYQFAGVATTATKPGTPDAKVFYIANGKGTYANFGNIEVTEDEVVVLYYDTEWHKVATGIASQAKLAELSESVNAMASSVGEPLPSDRTYQLEEYPFAKSYTQNTSAWYANEMIEKTSFLKSVKINNATATKYGIRVYHIDNGVATLLKDYGEFDAIQDSEVTIEINDTQTTYPRGCAVFIRPIGGGVYEGIATNILGRKAYQINPINGSLSAESSWAMYYHTNWYEADFSYDTRLAERMNAAEDDIETNKENINLLQMMAENLIVNGTFNGTDGWVNVGETSNNIANTGAFRQDTTKYIAKAGDVIYVRLTILSSEDATKDIYMQVDNSGTTDTLVAYGFRKGKGFPTIYPVALSANWTPRANGTKATRFIANIIGGKVECAGAMMLNLTSIFGRGNEPTNYEMDALINQMPNYGFDGMKNLATQLIKGFASAAPKKGAYIRVNGLGNVELASTINPNWDSWNDKAISYGMSKNYSPIYNIIRGTLETDSMYSVIAKYGRWSGMANGNQYWGGHVFEGWNNARTNRVTIMIGANAESEAGIIVYRPGGVNSEQNKDTGVTDGGGKFGVVRLGNDQPHGGFLFTANEMVALGTMYLPYNKPLIMDSPNGTHYQIKVNDNGEIVATRVNHTSVYDNYQFHTCPTAANDAEKKISIAYRLLGTDQDEISNKRTKVKFTNANTASNPTFCIMRKGEILVAAKPLYYNGSLASSSNTWSAKAVVEITWDDNAFYATNV